MKKAFIDNVVSYVAPDMEVLSTVVERGFEASFGGFGEAGSGFDVDDNGDF